MPFVMSFLMRLLLVVAGVVVAASAIVMAVLVGGLLLVRAAWCRLTGRPMLPPAFRFAPEHAFRGYARAAQPAPDRSAARPGRPRGAADVTDVEPK